jgi:predicted RNA methylase
VAANTSAAATADTGAAVSADAAATADADGQATDVLGSDTKKVSSGDSGSDDEATEPDPAAHARKAYQSVIEDSPKSSGISAADRQTMEEFKSVINELKQILEKAMRELRQKNRQDDGLGGQAAAGSLATTSTAIPSSIVI